MISRHFNPIHFTHIIIIIMITLQSRHKNIVSAFRPCTSEKYSDYCMMIIITVAFKSCTGNKLGKSFCCIQVGNKPFYGVYSMHLLCCLACPCIGLSRAIYTVV